VHLGPGGVHGVDEPAGEDAAAAGVRQLQGDGALQRPAQDRRRRSARRQRDGGDAAPQAEA
jgi:hypothetical protein